MNKPINAKETLKVLQVTQFLEIGGLEALVIGLCRQLKIKGVVVELLCLHEIDEKYSEILRKSNIPVHVIPENNWFNIKFFQQVSGFIRKKQFDVVHCHSGCHLNIALFCMRAGTKKLVYTAHGMPMFTGLRDRLEDSLAGFLTSNVVSVSAEIEKFLKKWFWFPRCQFETILNGIDTNKFRPVVDLHHKDKLLKKYSLPAGRILFGSVGRLAAVKNYSMALQAVKRLVDGGLTDICFVLVGEGSSGIDAQEQYLRDLVVKLNISDQVCFLGMQYDIDEILPLFHFFVLTSLTEGTSISLLESQACGIPAVVTDVGGNSEVVFHPNNGYLCPSKDDKKMAAYMKELIENDVLVKEMGANGRKRVKGDFSVGTMTEKYLRIYHEEA